MFSAAAPSSERADQFNRASLAATQIECVKPRLIFWKRLQRYSSHRCFCRLHCAESGTAAYGAERAEKAGRTISAQSRRVNWKIDKFTPDQAVARTW